MILQEHTPVADFLVGVVGWLVGLLTAWIKRKVKK